MLARCVHLLGAKLGSEVIPTNVAVNRDGFFEDAQVVALNDQLLEMLGSSWYDFSPLKDNAIQTQELERWQDQAQTHLAREYAGKRLSVMKDPRMSRLWRFWVPLFQQAGIGTDIAQIIRRPERVAWSLKHRDAMPVAYGVLLWCAHVTDALNGMGNDTRWTTFFYDAFTADPETNLDLLRSTVSSASSDEANDADIKRAIGKPRDLSAMRGDQSLDLYQPLADYAWRLYAYLENHCAKGKLEIDRPAVQRLIAEYYQLLDSHALAFQALKAFTFDLMAASAKQVEIGELHAQAQRIVTERDGQLDKLNQELARVGAELQHAQRIVGQRDEQLGELNQQISALQQKIALYESGWFRRAWRRLWRLLS